MWRAMFLALGAVLLMLGLEYLALDHVVVAPESLLGKRMQEERVEVVTDEYGFEVGTRTVRGNMTRKIDPPEWAPWSMISSGAVIILYSLSSQFGSGSAD